MRRTRTFISLSIVWIAFFTLSKTCFALFCADEALSFVEVLLCLWHGFKQDLSMAGYLVSLPLLCLWVSVQWPRFPLKRVLRPWHGIAAVGAVLAVLSDMALYPFWGTKLDASYLSYLETPKEAFASVSLWFVVWRLALLAVIAVVLFRELDRSLPTAPLKPASRWWHLAMPIVCGLLFIVIRGGVGRGTMNVATAYHSDRKICNHVAVNPMFSFLSTLGKSKEPHGQFQLISDAQTLAAAFADVYPDTSQRGTDTLLVSSRPNVLLVIWESGGSQFFAPHGGEAGVMSNLEKMASEGVLFNRMYSGAWRTDRGLLCVLSGQVGYPTLSVLKQPRIAEKQPCLGRVFQGLGYDTFFLYGGDSEYAHMAGFLRSAGYPRLIDQRDFSAAGRDVGAWGVHDGAAFDRLFDEIKSRAEAERPWHATMLTLSSHEPFDVPYRRFKEDKAANSMAYTDYCLGHFVERLKGEPKLWNNLLLIVLPDHGMRCVGVDTGDDLFHHAPMIWTGGAVARARQIDTIMSQSDMAATLLAQLGLPHSDFPYSRDVLSPSYTYHSAYCTTAEFVKLIDDDGTSLLNVNTLQIDGQPAAERDRRLKAVLQTTYDRL